MKTKSQEEQAREYIAEVGWLEAQKSNHYLTAQRHCTCGDCFCCWVKRVVDDKKAFAAFIAGKKHL